ncbi:hypothetical protein AX774_g5890, partial [Zancudomyces culisetae]
MSITVHTF